MNEQINVISLLENISENDYWESNSPAEEESILKVEQEFNQNFLKIIGSFYYIQMEEI